MRLGAFHDVYAAAGPVLTAYLDVSRDHENSQAEIELRWRALHEELSAAGAPDAVLDAAADRLLGQTGEHGACGRMVVANDSGVLLDRLVPGRPAPLGTWGELAHLLPLVTTEVTQVPHVLVVADRVGADITVRAPAGAWSEEVEGEDFPISKPNAGGWSQRRYEDSAENLWEHNATDVANRVDDLVRATGAELLAVAGDVRAVQLLEKHLPERSRKVLHALDSGARGEGASREALEEDLQRALAQHAAWREGETVQEFLEQRGRADRATSGLPGTVEALRRAQVDVLLLPIGWDGEGEAWFGPQPTELALAEQDIHALGVPDPRRGPVADVLLRAAAGTEAALAVVPDERLEMGGEPAALLRWSDAATRSG